MNVASHTIIKADTLLGEGPLWCERTQALLWIDGARPQILRWRWGAGEVEAWPQVRPPAALALTNDSRLVVAFRARFGVAERPGEKIKDIDMPDIGLGDERFNDAKVDAAGRLWIGTIDRQLNRRIGSLRCFGDEGIQIMDRGFAQSNGIDWSPDGRQMYFSESFDRIVHRYRFDVNLATIRRDGMLACYSHGNPGEVPKPDGLTVDEEGGIWCVIFGAGRIDRYLPTGVLERSINLPVTRPTSCTFGGPEMRTLFITTATYGLSKEELVTQPHAGSILAIEMDVAGLPAHRLSIKNILLRAADAS